jgi:nitric oxide reductase NorD protein
VHPFCLTVDFEEPEYLPHLFGHGGYTILRKADQLPHALLAVVRQLLNGA